LSLYHPDDIEIELLKNGKVKAFYDITTRIGKVGKDFNLQFSQKNPIICFTEGSTFFTKDSLKGNLVSTAKFIDEKDIYSNYLFFGIKANLRLQ
jgi:CRISPR/Cas system CSM-associated protein Csm4 (group 5 of RAMP superfamily)